MLRRLDEDEILKIEPPILGDTNSKARQIALINESRLYTAILGSKKEEAKIFKKWVTKEILPQIRKNDYYLSDNLTEQQETKLVEEVVTNYEQGFILSEKEREIVLEEFSSLRSRSFKVDY
jgi:anti-repressor protein